MLMKGLKLELSSTMLFYFKLFILVFISLNIFLGDEYLMRYQNSFTTILGEYLSYVVFLMFDFSRLCVIKMLIVAHV